MSQRVLTAEKALLVASVLPRRAGQALEAVREADPRFPAIEVRLDALEEPLDLSAVRAACPGRVLLATLRTREEGGRFAREEAELRAVLAAALDAGIDLVDVELARAGSDLLGMPRERVVVSRHCLDGVPDDVDGSVEAMRRTGARYVKLVATPQTFAEALALLGAQRRLADGRTALFGMGELGLATRVLSPYLGASLAYGALAAAAPTAPGQLAAVDLLEVYGVGASRRVERVYSLFGSRVSHSYSPALHNGLFGLVGQPALYVPVALGSFRDGFEAYASFLDDAGAPLSGGSVTVPFKGDAAAMVPCAGEAAVNTLVRDADGFRAFNTDRLALLDAIPAAAPGERALLLGAGGMAEAAATVLAARGYRLEVFARRPRAAAALAARHGGRAVEGLDGQAPYAVLVNATPIGLGAGDPLPCPSGLLAAGTLVVDSPYRKGGTALTGEAAARGCRVVDGFALLVGQAAGQASLFTGRAVSVDDLLSGLPARLKGLFAPESPAPPRQAAGGPLREVTA